MPRQSTSVRRSEGRIRGADRSDQQLVEGIRRGDQSDFSLLYDRYFPRVYAFVQQRLRNRADAEELVQEVFTAAFRSIDAYAGESSLAAWMYGIARNTVNNHIRRSVAQEQRLERAGGEVSRSAQALDACTPEEHLSLMRCEERLREQLASLAGWQAEAFLMRHVDDLSIDEIAERVARSNDAVRSSLYRVKKLLVEAVDPSGAVTV